MMMVRIGRQAILYHLPNFDQILREKRAKSDKSKTTYLAISIVSKCRSDIESIDHFIPFWVQNVKCKFTVLKGPVHGHMWLTLTGVVKSSHIVWLYFGVSRLNGKIAKSRHIFINGLAPQDMWYGKRIESCNQVWCLIHLLSLGSKYPLMILLMLWPLNLIAIASRSGQEVIRDSEVVYFASLGFECVLMQLPDS